MHAELEYAVMQNHASELRRAAAARRLVREAEEGQRSGRRSLFARFLAS
jgi:hypothetical protein